MEHELTNCLNELARQMHVWPKGSDCSYGELMFRYVQLERQANVQHSIQSHSGAVDSVGVTGDVYGNDDVAAFTAALGGEGDEPITQAA